MKIIHHYINEARFAVWLFVILIVLTLIITPSRFAFDNLGTTLGLVAPLILTACALTPVFLAGREGIDLSVGPAMGFISVVMVKIVMLDGGITHPLFVVPLAVTLGGVIGVINGYIAVYIRVQPIVTTLGSYLVLSGLASAILPAPMGPVPDWLRALSEGYSILPLLGAGLFWLSIKRLPLYRYILTLGGEDRAVYASGINVDFIRFLTYVMAGVFVGLSALALTGLLGSADAQVAPHYTLLAIAAAALGGVSLAGGKGTMVGATLGAVDIFLLQNLITHFNVSSFVLQIVYGLILVLAVALNSDVLINTFFKGKKYGTKNL